MDIETDAMRVTSGTSPSAETEIEVLPLEDRIMSATLQNYRDLLAEISQFPGGIQREAYAAKLAKALGVSKTNVSKEMQILAETDDVGNSAPEYTTDRPMKALFPGLVDLVEYKGNVVYLVKSGNRLDLVDTWEDPSGIEYSVPDRRALQFRLANADNVLVHYPDTDDVQLFEDLVAFCKRFSYLEDDVWPIVVLAIFLSYLQDHEDVRYLPMIYFHAVAERGKSRTAKSMLFTSYRGIHLLDIRSANVFRFSENLGATLFLDVTDLTASAEKGDSSDILLGRFEKGTQVARVTAADKGPFLDQSYYNVFGSTIIATNEPANSILESRCLAVTMPNMPKIYENISPEMGLPFKERLTAFRARVMNTPLPVVEPIPGISGRLWDISEPLFRLALLVAPHAFEPMKQVILGMAGHKTEDMKETVEGQLVAAIDFLADFDGNLPVEIPVERIRHRLNADKPERFHISPQKLGKRIYSLGLKTKAVKGLSRLVITARELDKLKEQYGLSAPAALAATLPLATTPGEGIDNQPEKVPDAGDVESGRESGQESGSADLASAYHRLINQTVAEPAEPVKPRRRLWNRPDALAADKSE